jgi:alpha-beta hydrolase superfamily lysophospholipase
MVAASPVGRVLSVGHAAVRTVPWWARIVAVLSMAVLAGCGSLSGAATTNPVRAGGPAGGGITTASTVTGGTVTGGTATGSLPAFYQTPDPLDPAPAGAIIRSAVIPSAGFLPQGATAYRVLYHSQSLGGADIAVSGLVVVPGGAPPPTGFPIVSWAHGTTGLAQQCAPSLEGFTSIPLLDSLLDRHAIVAATDYEGLGTSGVDPYLVGQSEGQTVLDAARAARDLVGAAASNVVVVLGYSQGGQAALFASQIAASYAPELFVAGAAAAAPVTSLDEFVPQGSPSGADPAAVYAVMALDAWSATYGNLALSSVLTPTVVRRSSTITSECSGTLAALYDTTDSRQLFVPGWADDPTLQSDVARNEPGRSPTATPLLVVEGTDDTLTPYPTVSAFVHDALCRTQDDAVEYVPLPGSGHGGAMVAGAPVILRWISARLAGAPVPDSCSRLVRAGSS